MHRFTFIVMTFVVLVHPSLCPAQSTFPEASGKTTTVLLDVSRLESIRNASPDTFRGRERQVLLVRADKLLEDRTTYSVTENTFTPEGATLNDYYSMGPYWWPNPDTGDGLPYVNRDGKVNPERDRISDFKPLRAMIKDVNDLALAYALSGDEPYAEFGVKLLRTWFLVPETKMNPHLRFAQGVPGVSTGRNFGIIDTLPFIGLVDSIALLGESEVMDTDTSQGLKEWFQKFLYWLQNDPFGKQESTRTNNHSTSYDLQVLVIALSLGESDWARNYLMTTTLPRIDSQIMADGSQPEEFRRTKSWNYTCGNLHHFMRLGILGQRLGVDVFHYPDKEQPRIKAALDLVLPYVDKPEDWPHEMIVKWQPERLRHSLSIASEVYADPRYAAEIQRLGWTDLPMIDYFISPRP